jgi:hypothetical protein
MIRLIISSAISVSSFIASSSPVQRDALHRVGWRLRVILPNRKTLGADFVSVASLFQKLNIGVKNLFSLSEHF